MIVEKHLIGQTVIVPYMEDTDRRVSNLSMQKKRHHSRKTSDWSNSDFPYMEDIDSDILGLGFP